jgi:hypothetical protein
MAVVMAVPDSYRPPRRNAADLESVCGATTSDPGHDRFSRRRESELPWRATPASVWLAQLA